MDLTINDMLSTLGYTEAWLEHGILTEDIVSEQIEQFTKGEDRNTEHYRYRVLENYIKSQTVFEGERLRFILRILQNDSDQSMAISAMILLLKSKALDESQFTSVADFLETTFGEHTKRYIKKAKRNRV